MVFHHLAADLWIKVSEGGRRQEREFKRKSGTDPKHRTKGNVSKEGGPEEACWNHQWEGVSDAPMLGSWPSNFTHDETWHLKMDAYYFIGKFKINWLIPMSCISEGLVSSYSFSEKKKKRKFRQGWQGISMPATNWREVGENSQYLPLVFLISFLS